MRRRMLGFVVVVGMAASVIGGGHARGRGRDQARCAGPADRDLGRQVGAGLVVGALERRIEDHDPTS